MTKKEIFHAYFKKKILFCLSLGIVGTLIRIMSGHNTSFALILITNSFFVVVAIILGYFEYLHYEKKAPKIIAELIKSEPLNNFETIGFKTEENHKLEGELNGYKVIFSPIINMQNETSLITLLPLQPNQSLLSQNPKLSKEFNISASDGVAFAQAIIKNYNKEHTYSSLLNLINTLTADLKELKIEPLKTQDS